MEPHRTLAKFERSYARWRSALEAFGDAGCALRPEGGGWCAGEVADHVARAGHLILDQIQRCVDGRAEDRGFQLKPALLCALGSLPPVRVRVPEVRELAEVARPEALPRTVALERLEALAARTRASVHPARDAPRRQRTRHPIAGYLHAAQWFQFNEMHLRHHLRQLARIGRDVERSAQSLGAQ